MSAKRTLRAGPVTVRVDTRTFIVTLSFMALALASALYAVATGEKTNVSIAEIVRTLAGSGNPDTAYTIQELRLPRAINALLVGAALGAAGAVFQRLTRNPLGSPDVIGFTQGAATGAVVQIIVFGGGAVAVAAGALVGGAVTAVTVYLLTLRGSQTSIAQLLLVGIGLSLMLAAVRSFLLTHTGLDSAQRAAVWLAGTLLGRGWEQAVPLALALVVLIPIAAALGRQQSALELGDDAARGFGVHPERSRIALLAVGAALTGVATAAAGPLAFVALMAPQIAQRLTRAPVPGVMPAAAMGALLLSVADVATKRVFGVELPVGILTAGVGGAYLVWLLSRELGRGRA